MVATSAGDLISSPSWLKLFIKNVYCSAIHFSMSKVCISKCGNIYLQPSQGFRSRIKCVCSNIYLLFTYKSFYRGWRLVCHFCRYTSRLSNSRMGVALRPMAKVTLGTPGARAFRTEWPGHSTRNAPGILHGMPGHSAWNASGSFRMCCWSHKPGITPQRMPGLKQREPSLEVCKYCPFTPYTKSVAKNNGKTG